MNPMQSRRRVGARCLGDGSCSFAVWAPFARSLDLKIGGGFRPMGRDDAGYFELVCGGTPAGTDYLYRLNGLVERPDPASGFQPAGVHGPSRVVDHAFEWHDGGWGGIPQREMVIYEVHVGTFTKEGTFAAMSARLPDLCALGVNTIELMPVAQFPGERSWGYDGVYPFAVQSSYGGPRAMKELVDACHGRGLAVILDVVYNHQGPEGNYLGDFGPYFTDRYRTPWGSAMNFDGPYSDEVRNFFIENALHWIGQYHVDGLRLDAVHAIFDQSARPFLAQLASAVARYSEESGRGACLIAESDLNDPRVVRPEDRGGLGMDGQWSDDFHHAVHALLTGERQGYYVDFGSVADVVTAVRDGFVYQGRYSVFRRCSRGGSTADVPSDRLVVFCQDHDQVGNRMKGDRLSTLVPFGALKLAAGVLLASPYVPLLFMGEEYGEENPFLYFIDHSDPELIRAVREGRKEEFKAFSWTDLPDPADVRSFTSSGIDWDKRETGRGRMLCDYYRSLLALRRELPCLAGADRRQMEVYGAEADRLVIARICGDGASVFWLANFDGAAKDVSLPLPEGRWRKVIDSCDEAWGGRASLLPDLIDGTNPDLRAGPHDFALFAAEG